MSTIYASLKIVFMIIWFMIMGIVGLLLSFGNFWKSTKRLSSGAKWWASGNAFIVRLKKHYFGDKPKVKGIVVSNHMSYLDIITAASTFNIRFAPNTDIAKWPILGKYLGVSKPIWVDRNSRQSSAKIMKEFVETANHDINLIVFPEGGISNCKQGLQNFKSTVFEAAIRGNVPIIPILIHYHNEDVCWTKWKLLKHIWFILKLNRIPVDVHYLPPVFPNKNETRKELSERVFNLMNSQYKKIYCAE